MGFKHKIKSLLYSLLLYRVSQVAVSIYFMALRQGPHIKIAAWRVVDSVCVRDLIGSGFELHTSRIRSEVDVLLIVPSGQSDSKTSHKTINYVAIFSIALSTTTR